MSRLFVLAVLTTSALADFNNTKCPGHWEVSSQNVVDNFDMNKFVGTYYEQALHDITQYPTCPKLSCIRSVKTWTEKLGGDFQISDTFSIECFGKTYTNEYYFNTTDDNGFLVGFLDDPPAIWKILFGDQIYPDTIVEFKESADGGQYEWVVEFQCTDADDGDSVRFTGFNFYSREQNPSDETVSEMIQAARDAGLSIYMDAWPGVYNVTQTGCAYDEVAEPGASRQGHLRG
mmetsp:Transcript_57892/g.159800  ORF Transcript_57892/g.159800 Transcript_57892/m.159800 type:complete len:232 (-) Transcript_57892:212-907(-)|eukprot:CAMPEP_0119472484 /NCGR_PEP_ID=MMETSP1344-20130328/4529_1 /TAXON_ID=236787 /ORGANISM="Florenciella parvula, Strain CCMP2471" /LENGTH=231 /DNA_ID=CAMNT_0007505443 /DNA_START=78 /DNA_END=773 /DNA_ORIENTATION=+